jgi:HSP20 family molecular chaperone IbpA
MHTLIQPIRLARSFAPGSSAQGNVVCARGFAVPLCDVAEKPDQWMATVYLPGTTARGIELLVAGRRLAVTARRDRPVRANWWTLGLERCLKDYRRELYLGRRFDPATVQAEFADGVLTLRASPPSAKDEPCPSRAADHVA